jgi:two-component system OmpR family response regulator
MTHTIAIVEDDPVQRTHYADALRGQGYAVTEYADREQATRGFGSRLPDLAILDIILQDDVGGGFEVCRYLKQRDASLPIIFLTSRGNELDMIYGLQLGAWDYQTKPVSLDFLITRIQSLFRIRNINADAADDQRVQTHGELEINTASMRVQWKQQAVQLTPTEFDILRQLVAHADGASIEELARATRQGVVEDNTVNTHILHIRKKFRHIDAGFNAIRTRYGYGYAWAPS